MILKILQLNIYRGLHLNKIIDFVKKNDIDICQFQEVTGGNYSLGKVQGEFEVLKQKLNLEGVLVKEINPKKSPQDYFGKATFFRKDFKVLEQKIIWMKRGNYKLEFAKAKKQTSPRCALSLLLEINGQKIYFVNTHMAWGPTPFDKKFKQLQADKLLYYLTSLKHPFVLTGDFNLVPSTDIVKSFSKIAKNLTTENNIKFTLNPEIHYLKDDVKKRNLAVDFVFLSKEILPKSFTLVTENLSDHYGIIVDIVV